MITSIMVILYFGYSLFQDVLRLSSSGIGRHVVRVSLRVAGLHCRRLKSCCMSLILRGQNRMAGSSSDLDLSSLWNWTIPLWALFLIILFLCGILGQQVVLQSLEGIMPALPSLPSLPSLSSEPATQSGSGRPRRVRFAAGS